MNNELIKKLLEGDILSCAKLISIIENNESEIKNIIKEITPHTKDAFYLGITGPAGCGKSTIIDKLVELILKSEKKIGIVCVDPSSVFSGGALLGDRIRLKSHFTKENVFIRSMATRGSVGGLARSSIDAAKIITACGFEYIILETTGVGQQELDIAKYADVTVVVLQPLIGDEIQLLKAGLIEIADILVVNKKDIPFADEFIYELKEILKDKNPQIIPTSAINNIGIEELWNSIENYSEYLIKNNLINLRRKEKIKRELISIIQDKLIKDIKEKINDLEELVEEVFNKKIDVYTAAEEMIKKIKYDEFN